MTPSDSSNIVTYAIDADDRLIRVGDAWSQFADENDGGGSLKPESILGSSIWASLRGSTLLDLYREVVGSVRKTGVAVEFPFRCDSPGFVRRLQMRISPLEENAVAFSSAISSITRRDAPLSVVAYDQASTTLQRCSICNLFRLRSGDWSDATSAVSHDAIFDANGRVQIIWTVCQTCRRDFRAMASDLTPRARDDG